MYISSWLTKDRKNIVVWERKDGKRLTKTHPAPWDFYIPRQGGEYRDIYGNELEKVEFSKYSDFKDAKNQLKSKGVQLRESDIQPKYKILISEYYKKSNGRDIPNILFYDIEVDYDKETGHASPENPYARISSVAIHQYWCDKSFVLAVPPEGKEDFTEDDLSDELKESNVEIKICKDEYVLLMNFLELLEDADIVSGWNSKFFDDPYVFERLNRVLGGNHAKRMNFIDGPIPKKDIVEFYFKNSDVPEMRQVLKVEGGRVFLDYLELYKKFDVEEKFSYSLEAISELELSHLDMKKLDYDGSLYDLYREDFNKFIAYNIRDTEILAGFENKLGYLRQAVDMAYDATSEIVDVVGTIKLAECAIISFCHHELNLVVPDSDRDATGGKYGGAYVLDPQVGMHEWVSSIDIASLYPSTMRSINISPEKIIGQFERKEADFEEINAGTDVDVTIIYENSFDETKPASEWKSYLKEKNWAISGYGTVFDLDEPGIITQILSTWFTSRKEHKNLKAEYIKKREKYSKDDKKYNEYKELANFHDRIQKIKKLQLNSMYGALGNKFFKFYDVRLAESTTQTGRRILLHMAKKVAKLLDKKYEYPSESMIYGDTDSCYFKTHASNREQAIAVGQAVEKKVNKSFPIFMQEAFCCNDDYKGLITTEQEIVADRGIFVTKKNYVLHLVYDEGEDVDKLKVMGLALKKTTIPKRVRSELTCILEEYLKTNDFDKFAKSLVEYRYELKKREDISDLGLPKGVKKVEHYTKEFESKTPGLRLPGHVAASILWNSCLDSMGDKESDRIRSGNKIRVYYLTKKIGYFKSIAYPVDNRKIPDWFKDKFVGLIDREAQVERLVDKPMTPIFEALGEIMPTDEKIQVDEAFSFD